MVVAAGTGSASGGAEYGQCIRWHGRRAFIAVRTAVRAVARAEDGRCMRTVWFRVLVGWQWWAEHFRHQPPPITQQAL